MKPFSNYYNLLEAARQKFSQQYDLLFNAPMFSVYISTSLKDKIHELDVDTLSQKYYLDFLYNGDTPTKEIDYSNLEESFRRARTNILKIGFPAMHANVLLGTIDDKDVSPQNRSGVRGFAHVEKRFIHINMDMIPDGNTLTRVIVHEWAHLWEFNNSAQFKQALKEFYKGKVSQNSGVDKVMKNFNVDTLAGNKFNTLRRALVNKGTWHNNYGLTQPSEMWATGIDRFLNLPDRDRKAILKLMTVRGARRSPNWRMRKHNELKNK